MMNNSPGPKLPIICFVILSVTLFIGGLGTLGGAVFLFLHFPAGTPIYVPPVLVLNGLAAWILAGLCGFSALKLAKQEPKAKAVAQFAWVLVAGFALWTLLFDGLLGWSEGGLVEVVIWSVLEALIAGWLFKAERSDAD